MISNQYLNHRRETFAEQQRIKSLLDEIATLHDGSNAHCQCRTCQWCVKGAKEEAERWENK